MTIEKLQSQLQKEHDELMPVLNEAKEKLSLMFDSVELDSQFQSPMFTFKVTHKEKSYSRSFYKAPYKGVKESHIFAHGIILDIIEEIIK